MLRIRHRDKRTVWEHTGIKRRDCAELILQTISQFRVERPGHDKIAVHAPPHELDPAGWSAVWVTHDGAAEVETPLPIPALPPLVFAET